MLARLFFCLLSAVCCLLSACVSVTPRSQRPSPTAQIIPDMPLLKWGVVSCGAGSLSTVLQHYGNTTSRYFTMASDFLPFLKA